MNTRTDGRTPDVAEARATVAALVTAESEMVKVDALTLHPDNPRSGNVGVIVESIIVNGFYGTLVAQRSTGFILVGNHRFVAAKMAGLTELPVCWADVDDETARRILLVDNKTNDLAIYDNAALAKLLNVVVGDMESTDAADDALSGTSYNAEDLRSLMEQLNPTPPDEFPEYEDDTPIDFMCPKCGYEWSGREHP